MKKTLTFMTSGAFALMALFSCSEEEDTYLDSESKQGEESYASQATVSSADANYNATENGGTITFKTEGGTVTLNVSCECEWIAENSATDLFTTSATSNSLTITAVQNTVEDELTGTITFMTENYRIVFATVYIAQTAYGAPEISVETAEWNAPAKGNLTTEIAVESSEDWTVESGATWLTATKSGTGITLTAEENGETTERSTRVTLTCTDGIRTAYDYVAVNQDALAYINLSVEKIGFGATGGEESVTVDSNYDWDYSYESDWFSVTKNSDGSLTVTCGTNEDVEDREGSVTFSTSDGAENVSEATLAILQGAAAYIKLSATELSFGENEDETTVTVESNYDWEYSTECSWVTLSKASDGTSLTVNVSQNNDPDEREGTVVLTAGDETTIAAEAQIKITQEGSSADMSLMILTYTITSASTSVKLPIYGTVDCSVDWGDGTTEKITSTLPSHTYKSVGEYDVTISGTVTQLYCKTIATSSNTPPITAVKQWGETGLVNMEYAFYYCKNLVSLPTYVGNAFDNVTSFYVAFENCQSLEEIPAGMFNNCSKVTTFREVFNSCSSITEIPEGLFDNCTANTTFYSAFNGCSALKAVPKGLFDDSKAVTSFHYLFGDCTALETIPEGLFDNCTEATDFDYTFYKCSSLTEIPEGLFAKNTKAKTFAYAFYNASSIKKIPEKLFADKTAVTTFARAFYGCSSLETLPSDAFDNCSSVTTYEYCFYNCKALVSIPSGLFDSGSNVTTFAYCFYNCSSAPSIPDGLFDNCTAVTAFNYTFYGCKGFISIPVNLFKNCTKVTNFGNCFNSSGSSTHNLSGESAYDLVDIDGVETMIHLYERGDHTDIYTKPSTTSYCYRYQTGLQDYSSLPSGWY